MRAYSHVTVGRELFRALRHASVTIRSSVLTGDRLPTAARARAAVGHHRQERSGGAPLPLCGPPPDVRRRSCGPYGPHGPYGRTWHTLGSAPRALTTKPPQGHRSRYRGAPLPRGSRDRLQRQRARGAAALAGRGQGQGRHLYQEAEFASERYNGALFTEPFRPEGDSKSRTQHQRLRT